MNADKTTICLVALSRLNDAHGMQSGRPLSDDEISRIASDPRDWRAGVGADVVDVYGESIDHVIRQIRFNMDPLEDVPLPRKAAGRQVGPPPTTGAVGIGLPASGAPTSRTRRGDQGVRPGTAPDSTGSASGSSSESNLARWRDRMVAAGDKDLKILNGMVLKQVARRATENPSAVENVLPANLRKHAAQIVAAVRGGEAPAERPTAEAAGAAPNPQAPPLPARPAAPQPTPRMPARPNSPGDGLSPSAPGELDAAAGEHPNGTVDPAVLELGTEDFAPYEYLDEVEVEVGVVSVTAAIGGGLRLKWPEWPDEDAVVIYRLVERPDIDPFSPDESTLVATTTATEYVDHSAPSSALRLLQVWVNAGRNHLDARNNQPVKLAAGTFVNPVSDVLIQEDSGTVVAQWRTWPGTERVDVYRIPHERAGMVPPNNPSAAMEYRICPAPNLRGFVDTTAIRGQTYQYRVYTQVAHQSSVLQSRPVQKSLHIQPVLTPVTDLGIEISETPNGPRFTLTWTAPDAGLVVIYRSDSGPAPGAEEGVTLASQLSPARLVEDARLGYPVSSLEDGRETMADVPWPDGWDRTLFTPVTVDGDKVRIGTTISSVRVASMESGKLIDRIDRQVVCFPWPRSAIEVEARLGEINARADEITSTPIVTTTREGYTKSGGLVFPRPLPAKGCSIALTPITFSAGQRVSGSPVVISYTPVLPVRYTSELKKSLTGQLKSAQIKVWAEAPGVAGLRFILIHNPDHLPLHRNDGEPIHLRRDGDETAQPALEIELAGSGNPADTPAWRADLEGRRGYVRLFANGDLPQLRVAVLDPAVDSLMVG